MFIFSSLGKDISPFLLRDIEAGETHLYSGNFLLRFSGRLFSDKISGKFFLKAHMDFPPIDKFYEDEFGEIDLEVYQAGSELWKNRAGFFAEMHLGDIAEGYQLMIKAIANISEFRKRNPEAIKNLSAYLFDSFKYLVFAELKKRNNRQKILSNLSRKTELDEEDNLIRKIVAEELLNELDGWSRKVFELHYVIGYEYKELVPEYGATEATIRSGMSKALKKLNKLFLEKTKRHQK